MEPSSKAEPDSKKVPIETEEHDFKRVPIETEEHDFKKVPIETEEHDFKRVPIETEEHDFKKVPIETEEHDFKKVPIETEEHDFKKVPIETEEHDFKKVPIETEVSKKSQASRNDFYDAYKGFSETTLNVIQKATSILEEEVAAGIIAARKVEEHFVDTSQLRSVNPEEVMHRFRRDAHEVVDIVIDIVNVAMNSMYRFSKNVIKIHSDSNKAKSEQLSSGQLPVITVPQKIKAGSSFEIPLSLENSGDTPTDMFSLYCTELVSASGERISASQILFKPFSITIDSHKTEKVIMTINIPLETKAGVYSGLVSATSLNQLRSMLIVQVD